jgi:hypothetical protein
MLRWTLIALVFAALLAPAAHASSPYARATLENCDREAREAVFEGRVMSYRQAAKMQMRFTLQTFTRDEMRWRKVDVDGFGEWITAPGGLTRYTYGKTVQELLPASYRTVVHFRWRDTRGKLIRSERAVSPVCRLPDSRPDLVVRDVHADLAGYVAVVSNRGREPAGEFDVSFVRSGTPLGSARVVGLEPGASVDVFLPGSPCSPGEQLEAIVDPGSEVDEADEENDSLSVTC